ncbi:MAG TPA: ParB/RepB/Spo0J family partition protein [Microvirga sp.]|nr:ParB/RepB/Spo0J family partition protein [Microvirga sp.]
MNLIAGVVALENKIDGRSQLGSVTHVALEDIHTDEATFQWREHGWERTWEGKEQIKDLVRHLRNTKEPLDPITVYERDGQLVVIDGHHRLKAYQEVWWEQPVPVQVFQGNLREAREAAFTANSKGQRPLTLQERQEKAWDYTKEWFFEGMKDLSKDWTAKRAGIAQGTVAKMRKTIRAKGETVKDLSWAEVMQGATEEARANPDPDWQQRKVDELREAMLSLNVIHYAKSPDILAKAIEGISPNLARALVLQWASIALDVVEDLMREDEEQERAVNAGLVPGI